MANPKSKRNIPSCNKRILGIDPGFRYIGYSVIEVGSAGSRILEAGCIETQQDNNKVIADMIERLELIVQDLMRLFKCYKPDVVSLESVSFVRNAQSMSKISLMWGACYAIAKIKNCKIIHIHPKDVKLGLGLSNTASKKEVLDSVKILFPEYEGWPKTLKYSHVSDATAIAYLAI